MSLDEPGAGMGVQVYEDNKEENIFIPMYRMMPHTFFDDESASMGCTKFYADCRHLIARGKDINDVLGQPVLDVSGLVNTHQIESSNPLSRWAVAFTLNLGRSCWQFQLANTYFVFHLMRVRTVVLPKEVQHKSFFSDQFVFA